MNEITPVFVHHIRRVNHFTELRYTVLFDLFDLRVFRCHAKDIFCLIRIMDQDVISISQFCYKIIALHGRHRQDFLGQERTSRSQFISLIHNPLFVVEWLQFSNIAVS